MSIIEAIILGLLQGLTEFLPISSSGHIELGKALLGAQIEDDVAFTIILHGATVLSILVVFRQDILNLLRGLFSFSWNEDTRYIAKLALSMLPVGIIGVLFESQIEELFEGRIVLVGICLIATAGILLLTLLQGGRKRSVGFKDAMIIGTAQAVAILPGISRSGSTIATALALGIDKEKATRFSFLMVLAPILGATLLKMKDLSEATTGASADGMLLAYGAGFVAAFLSGWAACTWMLNIVKQGKITWFSYYCLIAGVIAIIFGMTTT